MGLWQSYESLTPRTRIIIGLSGMAFATVGLLVSDRTEEKSGMEAKEEGWQQVRPDWLPRVYTVEKGEVERVRRRREGRGGSKVVEEKSGEGKG